MGRLREGRGSRAARKAGGIRIAGRSHRGEWIFRKESDGRLRIFPRDLAPHQRQSAFDHLPLLDRPGDKLRYILRVLFAPTLAERRLVRLPRPLAFLYYPLRVLRVGGKWGGRLAARR